MSSSQTTMVLKHLNLGRSITPLEAFGVYGIFRLAARINDLRDKGHVIDTKIMADERGKKYAEYTLIRNAIPEPAYA